MNDLYKKIDVGANEYVSKFSVNRNIKKLLYNDQLIYKLYNKYMKSGPGVFIKGLSYPIGYKVWFRDAAGNLGIYTNMIDNNTSEPAAANSNWINTSVAALPDGMTSFEDLYKKLARDTIQDHIAKFHEGEPGMVKADLSNIGNFSAYPYETKHFKRTYYSGYVRRWRSSLLEYFINYAFSDDSVQRMSSADLHRYFGGILNSYGDDLKTYANPTIPRNVNEYFETSNMRSVKIDFVDRYFFKDNDYCVFTSNALDSAGMQNAEGGSTDKNNYSPIDTVQVYNKQRDGLSVMRRFSGASYVGNVIDNETAEQYLKNVYARVKPANKRYTMYIVGTWE